MAHITLTVHSYFAHSPLRKPDFDSGDTRGVSRSPRCLLLGICTQALLLYPFTPRTGDSINLCCLCWTYHGLNRYVFWFDIFRPIYCFHSQLLSVHYSLISLFALFTLYCFEHWCTLIRGCLSFSLLGVHMVYMCMSSIVHYCALYSPV